MRFATRPILLVSLLIGLHSSSALANFQVNLTFNDSESLYSSYYGQITAGAQAAAADWGGHLVSAGTLRLQVNFVPPKGNTIASAGSAHSTFVGMEGDLRVYQQGALTAITGGSPSSWVYDAVLNISTNYLVNTLWFDPDPASRLAAVPSNKIDAQSVFLHEFGHILFMSGWRDRTTGELPAGYMSTFDQHIIKIGDDFFFDGTRANALYGGPVPLTSGNLMHLGGNPKPEPGHDLVDLMNPLIPYGQRRYISDLDLAIAADAGVRLFNPGAHPPPYVPEPSSLALLGIGILVVGVRRRVGRRAA